MMYRLLCYSYKGGSGRTTATANLASSLAQRGYKVLCLDMDIEGPGLSVLFDAEQQGGVYLQDYLRQPENFSLKSALVDIGKIKPEWDIGENRLFLLPASVGFQKPVNYTGDRPRELMKQLLEEIEAEVSPDFLLMDSPSGYGDMSALSMVFADFLLLIFRWSRQHVLGSVRIAEFLKYLNLDYVPIASSVPQPISAHMSKYQEVLENHLGKNVLCFIPEDDELKWRERVLIFDRTDSDVVKSYQTVVDYLEDRRKLFLDMVH